LHILFCSVPFRPSVGGIETVSELLAEAFTRAGHTVVLVTDTPSDGQPDPEPYRIVRRPNAWALAGQVRAADVVFHNNISLRLAWPLLLWPRPWVVAHHTWIPRHGLAGRAKRLLLRCATQVAASQALAAGLSVPAQVLPNPYRTDRFRPLAGINRDRDVAFLGRLVSDKGAVLLVEALARLAARGLRPSVTVIGDGPERATLEVRTQALGLADRIDFVGSRGGDELVALLHRHRVLVVPSLWEEPFGVVVLEALACGCVPLVARSGGLPEAAGPCGPSFAKGDAVDLADGLEALLGDPEALARWREPVASHLARHAPERVGAAYLEVLAHAARRRTVAGA
jgi:glycosyltransferase involved in cell wall biosynthesis